MKNREKRSRIMRAVKSYNTAPELIIRSLVHRMGYRFRLHRKNLPGKPDLVFVKKRKIIFVHGCFWHGHKCKRGNRMPKSNREYWRKKIYRNRERDLINQKELNKKQWLVLTIWECETRHLTTLTKHIHKFLKKNA